MSSLSKTVLTTLLMVTLTMPMTTLTVYAEDGESNSLIDRVKSAASDAADWARERAPAAKEKAGKAWETTKEAATEVRDDFKEWNQNQEDEFWERTNEQLAGATGGEDAAEQTEPETDDAAEQDETEVKEDEESLEAENSEADDGEIVEAKEDDKSERGVIFALFFPAVVLLLIFASPKRY